MIRFQYKSLAVAVVTVLVHETFEFQVGAGLFAPSIGLSLQPRSAVRPFTRLIRPASQPVSAAPAVCQSFRHLPAHLRSRTISLVFSAA